MAFLRQGLEVHMNGKTGVVVGAKGCTRMDFSRSMKLYGVSHCHNGND